MGGGFENSSGHTFKYTNGRVKVTGQKSMRSSHPQQQPGRQACQSDNPTRRGLTWCICSPTFAMQGLRGVVIVAL